MAAVTSAGLLALGCSSHPSPTPAAASHTRSASPRVSGPCASVRTTTPITDVPQACAELWAPYQVTKVPPPDILEQEHVPPAPPVVNMTNGAVSDATAQLWADASNRDSGWFKWAEANDQPALLMYLVGPAVISSQDEQALSEGARILQPDCDLYPTRNELFVVGPEDKTYFARKQLPTDASFVFVVLYSAPCAETALYPDGHTESIQDFTQQITTFVPGTFRSDHVLGSLWYSDAGGHCQDPAGPPVSWCAR